MHSTTYTDTHREVLILLVYTQDSIVNLGSYIAIELGIHIPYFRDQAPPSNYSRTSGSAERNSGRARIVAAAKIQVPRIKQEDVATAVKVE